MKEKIKKVLKNRPKLYAGAEWVSGFLADVANASFFILSILFSLMPKKKKIAIKSFYGRGYGNNAKYIVEELVKHDSDVEIVWLVNKKGKEESSFPSYITPVLDGRMRELYHLATAKVWIDDCRKVRPIYKSRNQFYLQTWHSPLRPKKIEKDAGNMLSPRYVKSAKRDSKNIDLMISGCDFSHNIYQRAFWYEGEIAKVGTPRCDIFFKKDEAIIEKVRTHFGIPPGSAVVLYAPTFRRVATDVYKFDYEKVRSAIGSKMNRECYMLIRLHPNVAHQSGDISYSDKVMNATYYEDMQDLLYVSDVLITDYSSSMFDMAIARKVCIMFAPDYEYYIKAERELYFDLDKLPFPLAKSESDLIDVLSCFDHEEYLKELEGFLCEIGNYEDGHASKRIAEILITKLS